MSIAIQQLTIVLAPILALLNHTSRMLLTLMVPYKRVIKFTILVINFFIIRLGQVNVSPKIEEKLRISVYNTRILCEVLSLQNSELLAVSKYVKTFYGLHR